MLVALTLTDKSCQSKKLEEWQMKKVFGTPGKFRKEREIIPVPEGLTRPCHVMRHFNCGRSTARNVLKQGYFIVDYRKKSICPGTMDPEEAYKLSWSIYHRVFAIRTPWYVEPRELVQEGVTGLLERAGDPRFDSGLFRFHVAKNAMRNYLRKSVRVRRETVNVDKDELIMYVDPSIDTWHKKNATEDLLLNLIDRKAT
jgi:hypothetical protein